MARRHASQQIAMFQMGEDLPLFTGTPVPVREHGAGKTYHVNADGTLAGWCIRCCAPLSTEYHITSRGPLCVDCAALKD